MSTGAKLNTIEHHLLHALRLSTGTSNKHVAQHLGADCANDAALSGCAIKRVIAVNGDSIRARTPQALVCALKRSESETRSRLLPNLEQLTLVIQVPKVNLSNEFRD